MHLIEVKLKIANTFGLHSPFNCSGAAYMHVPIITLWVSLCKGQAKPKSPNCTCNFPDVEIKILLGCKIQVF